LSIKTQFVELIDSNQGLINKVIFLYADSYEDRRDLKQEIVSQAWGAFKNYRREAKFSTWLYRVALNTALTTLKKAKRQEALKQRPITSGVELRRTDQEMIEVILSVLNPIEKSIVLLQVDGYSQQEIAEVLGISEGNTRTKIHRIRTKLEKHGIKELTSK